MHCVVVMQSTYVVHHSAKSSNTIVHALKYSLP